MTVSFKDHPQYTDLLSTIIHFAAQQTNAQDYYTNRLSTCDRAHKMALSDTTIDCAEESMSHMK